MHSCKSVMYIGSDALESLSHQVVDNNNSSMADVVFLAENWKEEEKEEVVVDHKDESGGS